MLIHRIESADQKHNGDVGKARIVLDVFADLIAVAHRHEYIGQHQVGHEFRELFDCSFAVGHTRDFVALILQGFRHLLWDTAIIVCDQDFHPAPPKSCETRASVRRICSYR